MCTEYGDYEDAITDEDFERLYQKDQRKLYQGGYKHTCPDCGTPNAVTDEQKSRGYHCDRCTQLIERGY